MQEGPGSQLRLIGMGHHAVHRLPLPHPLLRLHRDVGVVGRRLPPPLSCPWG